MLFCIYCLEFDADALNVPRSIKCELHMAERICHLREMKSQPTAVVRRASENEKPVFFCFRTFFLSVIFCPCNFILLHFHPFGLFPPFLTGIFFAATVFVSTQTVDMKDRTPRS